MESKTLTIVDNRTGKSYETAVSDETIRAVDLRRIKVQQEDFGLMTYDPGFVNTASCRSSITFIDGDSGILRYRGYSIDELAEKVDFLQSAYLIFFGELPTPQEEKEWKDELAGLRECPEGIRRLIGSFPAGGSAMGMLMSCLAALPSYYPSSEDLGDPSRRLVHLKRLIALAPVMSAYIYRHKVDLPFVDPDPGLPHNANFLRMVFQQEGEPYQAHPVFRRALNVLFVLHADHEQNCSTSAMRGVGSSRSEPYMAAAAATGALAGPLHGGANEAVIRMLDEIGSIERIPEYVERVKAGQFRLMGFGHRVYKNYDPRARIIRQMADEVLAVTGSNPALEMARKLEKVALEDEYFVKRKLYPNVDFYSGIIYQAMGFPTWMFPVLFAVARMAGWVAQYEEMMSDGEQRIARPRQIYTGYDLRSVGS